jgi:hypothetical protein
MGDELEPQSWAAEEVEIGRVGQDHGRMCTA